MTKAISHPEFGRVTTIRGDIDKTLDALLKYARRIGYITAFAQDISYKRQYALDGTLLDYGVLFGYKNPCIREFTYNKNIKPWAAQAAIISNAQKTNTIAY